MSERKVWAPEEDEALRQIFLVRKVQKWSSVSRIMENEYKLPGRTGKQCRQRWHNQLDPQIKNEAWGDDEEAKLFKWHTVHGNKWAKIAQHLSGRTDNAIKNHFYSTLRKGMRRLNKYISDERSVLKIKPIKNSLLQKIITLSGDRTDKKASANSHLIDKCGPIIEKLVACSKEGDIQQGRARQIRGLAEDLVDFDNKFKRRKYTKRKRQGRGDDQEEKEERIEKAEELMPAPQKPEEGFKRKVTNDSASLARKPSRSLLIGTDRYRSLEMDEEFGFNDPPPNKYFMTSSLESISILSSFQRRASEADLQQYTLFNPTISVDQTQGNSLMLGSKNISELIEGTNNGKMGSR